MDRRTKYKWKHRIVRYVAEAIFLFAMMMMLFGIIDLILKAFGIDQETLSVWWDILIVFGCAAVYEWFLWFFRIRLYITIDGIERAVIRGVNRK